MSFNGSKLFNLMPALYRLRDSQIGQAQLSVSETQQLVQLQGFQPPLSPDDQSQLDRLTAKSMGPLQCLLALIGEQVAAVEEDLQQLYDDQFIETCAPWVIPYIGALIGYKPVYGIAEAVANPRSEVAQTVSFRRRKGTAAMLEQLSRDVTGLQGAHVVEFFNILGDTQYLKHLRPQSLYSPDLRRGQDLLDVGGAFDGLPRTVETRRIAVGGKYNLHNLGVFLWRLNPYPVLQASALELDSQRYRISPLGNDMPLFVAPVEQEGEILPPSRPVNVPGRLKRRVLCWDILQSQKNPPAQPYYGEGRSLALYANGTLVPASQIRVCNLSGDDTAGWANMPPAGSDVFSIDPELGRIVLPMAPPAAVTSLQVSYNYGFSGDLGGGTYSRLESFTGLSDRIARVPTTAYPTLQSALDSLEGDGIVEVTDGGSYHETPNIQVKAGGHIELRSADTTRATLVLGGEMTVAGGAGSSFDLNGFLVTSSAAPASSGPQALVHAPATAGTNPNQLSHLGITHCTLVPGWALTPPGLPRYGSAAGLIVEPGGLGVVVAKSILGGIRSSLESTVSLSDSLLDATDKTGVAYSALDGLGGGGALTLEACTVVGKVHVGLLSLASDSLFWASLAPSDSWAAPLWADRKQEGCVRFCYLPKGPRVPRQFECRPLSGPWVFPGPLFTSLRYGNPGYGQLHASTDDSIRRGAEDGGEMGVFHFLLASQRETDLKVRLQEYLPVGLEYGIFHET